MGRDGADLQFSTPLQRAVFGQLANVIEESIRLRLEKQALAQRLGDEKQVVVEAAWAKTPFLAAASLTCASHCKRYTC
ncbi:MAG: hypothetical protein U1E57_02585 [Paenacidovorax caeni]